MSRPSDPQRPTPRPDPPEATEIVERIEAALRRHDGIDDHGIQVLLEDGMIILRGTVGSVDQRKAAEAVARTTPGLTGIRNELAVNGGIRATF